MTVGTKFNICRRYFLECVFMDRPNGDVDEKISVSEVFLTESILAWLVWLGVPSMRYMGSPNM